VESKRGRIRYQALFNNTTGSGNTAVGESALNSNTTAHDNTAVGTEALAHNTESFNTAIGSLALSDNTTGSQNTAVGYAALFTNGFNGSGDNNTAIGVRALNSAMTASGNTAIGAGALLSDNTGQQNTASGQNALHNNTSGSSNIALGYQAGMNLTTGSNNIDIGALGAAGEARRIRIGTAGTQNATFIAGIRGVTVPSGVGVIVGSNNQLGTVQSSKRLKEAIKPMGKASESILALKPVTFRYKHELDPDRIPQFGLVAEDVEKVNPDLVVRDENGDLTSVRYEAVNAMLLNEFLKEHRMVQELEKQVEKLTTGLQKVSAQLEASRSVPQVADSNY
jgi:hypothetical protein